MVYEIFKDGEFFCTAINDDTIVIHQVDGPNFKDITKEDFVDFLKRNLDIACSKYVILADDDIKEKIKILVEKQKARLLEDLQKKYARQATIEKHLKDSLDEYTNYLEKSYSRSRNITFTCWPGPHHGVPGLTTGLSEKSTVERLERVYDELSNNPWFRKGFGLIFKYKTSKDSYISSFGGDIEVMMSESDKAEERAGQKKIDDEILAYYANKRPGEYCGD
ncbi:hypothetical protein [uncultured Methanobrevibacter sp.]|uniref:hypothetical protein n=1 Tax=uncultured Methanobrevibacter sp. TaxID=253161 RepID=UPI0025E0E4D1|nr:hypothetical protein [uncultured Methanobrevibacter sp.]